MAHFLFPSILGAVGSHKISPLKFATLQDRKISGFITHNPYIVTLHSIFDDYPMRSMICCRSPLRTTFFNRSMIYATMHPLINVPMNSFILELASVN